MPSPNQIVPKWQHSYVETHIYDNTETSDTLQAEADDTYKTIHVFRSGKGVDNKIVKKTSIDSFVDTFGQTDFRKYGQPLMMPIATLNSGVASVYCMRIMPENATYANSALYAYYRVADVDVTEFVNDEFGDPLFLADGVTRQTRTVTKKMFQVTFRARNFSPEINLANNLVTNPAGSVYTEADLDKYIKENIADLPAAEDDENGEWACVPIGYFKAAGHGAYGNTYRWRISRNMEYEGDYERKIYNFEIIDVVNGVQNLTTYIGTAVNCIVNNTSLLINDVIGQYNDGEYPADIFIYEDAVDVIYDAYAAFLQDLATTTGTEQALPDITEFDVFFGANMNSEELYPNYMVVAPGDATYPVEDDELGVTLSDAIGTSFDGGHDGDFAFYVDSDGKLKNGALDLLSTSEYAYLVRHNINYAKPNETTKEDFAYIKAFNGFLDKTILSTRRAPAGVLFDANYSIYTKIALADFAIKRNDAVCYIDTGTEYSTFSTAVLRELKKIYVDGIFSDRVCNVNAHLMKVVDPYTHKNVVVTQTYFIASNIFRHWRENGIQTPFANSYAILDGYVRKSILPVVDLYEDELMNTLAQYRINYIVATGENEFRRGLQNTAQKINSDLLEENNMHILFWLKRNIEKDVQDALYNFANKSDRAAFRQVERAKYENIIGTMVSTFDIRFDMSEWESDRQIIHCYVEIQYRTLMKRGIIEIDVNKRDYTM